jgi:N-acetyl-anhydromuramyl-L-alanine amidase AmpD
MEKYGIPVENIVGHRDVAPGRKVDPDDSFPWHKLRDLLK